MILRLLRRVFTADAMGLILIFVALQTLTYGISSSLRGADTANLFRVCLTAALVGLGFSKARLNGMQASAWIAALGLIGVWILGAGVALPLFNLLKSIIQAGPQLFPSINYRFDVDTRQIMDALNLIIESSLFLRTRLQNWWTGFDVNVTINDVLVRNMIWTLVMWLVSAWIGWYTQRRRALLALMPAIFLMARVTSFSEQKVETLWLMVFLLLLLMGVWHYRNNIAHWETQRVDYSDSIRYDNTQAVLLLAAAIGIISFITPSISWREIRDYLRELDRPSKSETAEMLGIEEKVVPRKPVITQTPLLPREYWLSGGYAHSEKIVMRIKTGELPPVVIQNITTNAPRYYWRSVVYDQYAGAGWVTSPAPPQPFGANTPLIPGLLNGYRPIHLNVQMDAPEGKLFWTGVLYSADVPFTANWRVRPQSELFADQTALLQADMFAALSNATAYKVDSFIPTVTMEDLRTASIEYPEQIHLRYLTLDADVPERVHQLAQQITANKTNPYDKAKAIELYLRGNYPYDLEIPAPPQDQDVADYFLFDLRRGYCDYYATSMVVLARLSGIPARFVSGYASGEYDAPNAQYVIRELHAHSWVEVYFPEIGWVEFEPTGSQPEIDRDEKDNTQIVPDETKPESAVRNILSQLVNQEAIFWASPLMVVGVLLLVYYAIIERILLMRLMPAAAIDILYKRFYRLGRPLAGEYTRAETANEFTAKLIDKIDDVWNRFNRSKLSEHAHDNIQKLTDMYQLALFGKHILQKDDTRIAFNIWQRLRWQLFITRINNFILQILQRIPLRGIQRNEDRIN